MTSPHHSKRRFEQADLETAEEFAQRIALALENAKLFTEAKSATQSREEILSMVSHDLKNPLTGIFLNAEFLKKNPALPNSAQKPLKTIEDAAHQMNELIRDLVDLQKIDTGKLSVEGKCRACAAEKLVRDAIESQSSHAGSKNQRLELGILGQIPEVNADPSAILRVFQNLIGNAIKFTPRDGRIVVQAERAGDSVVFSVQDSGPGISPDLLPHVFDRYSQAKATANLGVGLGLAIAKGFVEAHGGRIWVESQLGAGSTFFFSIPVAKPLALIAA